MNDVSGEVQEKINKALIEYFKEIDDEQERLYKKYGKRSLLSSETSRKIIDNLNK